MEDEVLLDVYRSSWNDFLEAYKEKMNQNDALIAFVKDLTLTEEKQNKFNQILEKS